MSGTPRSSRKSAKRPSSPAASDGQTGKRKKALVFNANQPEGGDTAEATVNITIPNPPAAVVPTPATPEPVPVEPKLVFKDPNFVHSSKGTSTNKKVKAWKNLKQILAAERLLQWGPEDATYSTIEAPPSFKPGKKYSDLTGLPAAYTDPQTKIRYSTPDEFSRIRMLPSDIVAGYLALRKANIPVP